MKKYLKWLSEAHWLFLVIAIIFGVCFAKFTPPLWGLDEPAHFDRVYQISHGHFFPTKNAKNSDVVPSNLASLDAYVVGDLVDNATGGVFNRRDVRNEDAYIKYNHQHFSQQTVQSPITSGYSPIAYAGPVLGTVAANLFDLNMGHTILLARLGSLVVYSLLIVGAIWLLRNSKAKWLFMVVALFPTSLFQGSVISADGVLIGASMLFLATLIRLIKNDSSDKVERNLLVVLGATALILPLIKLNYIFLSAGILLVPADAFGRLNAISKWLKMAAVGLAGLFGVVWVLLMGVSDGPSQRPDGQAVSATLQLTNVISHPFHFVEACVRSFLQAGDMYLRTMTTQIGWNYIDPPLFITFLVCIAVIIAGLYAKDELKRYSKQMILLSLSVLLGGLSIFGVLYLAFSPVGSATVDGIQGRYFLPFLIPIVILIAIYLPIGVKINMKTAAPLFSSLTVVVLSTALYFYITATY